MKRILSILFLSALAMSCNSSQSETQGAMSAAGLQNGKIEFEEMSHDFGEITEGEVVSHAFKFKNTGTDPLDIISVNVSCGCTVASKPMGSVGVGQEDEIVIEFNSKGKVGENRKSVGVITNGQDVPSTLNFTATVKPAEAE